MAHQFSAGEFTIDSFSRSILEGLRTMRPRLPASAPDEFRLADVKHWVRRRWPLPAESVYTLQLFVRAFVDDEGWICQPHGVEVVRVVGVRRGESRLAVSAPTTLETTFEDGLVRTIRAKWDRTSTDLTFSTETEFLQWVGAPRDIADIWALFELERVEADEASRAWMEDQSVDEPSSARIRVAPRV